MAPARIDRVASFNMPLIGTDLALATDIFARLEADGVKLIQETGAEMGLARIRRLADMRYIGQGFEITVTLPESLDCPLYTFDAADE